MATDGIASCKWHALVRFGMWEDILAEPADPAWAKVNHCLRHYARGVAFAATNRIEEAEYERFNEARDACPEDKMSGSDATRRILDEKEEAASVEEDEEEAMEEEDEEQLIYLASTPFLRGFLKEWLRVLKGCLRIS